MQNENVDPSTGEVVRDGELLGPEFDNTAADGGIVPFGAVTAGDLINSMEDGQFSADIVHQMSQLAALMSDMAAATGAKQKGALTIKIDLVTEGGPFTAKANFKITPPKETRRPTLLFLDEKNRFTRTQPKQRQMFGIRQVGGSAEVRKI